MSKDKKILLAAGGTGGHMFPAQSLGEILKEKNWQIAMMTDARGKKHIGNIPADKIIEVEAASISPKHPLRAIKGVLKLGRGIKTAKAFLRDYRPDIIAGFGGYPAFPAMWAAKSLQIPFILHEQNAVLGRVNRVFAKHANFVASGFDILEKLPKGANWEVLGNPLREQINSAAKRQYIAPKNKINLLIVGGSLGAKLLSENVPQAIALLPDDLKKRLNIVQQTRKESLDFAKKTYSDAGIKAVCEPFFGDIEKHLAKAHYIIARAGASSVSEIMLMGLPSLLVPLQIAMDDHQSKNALPLKNLAAADILPESRFTPETIANKLQERLNDSSWLKTASKSARSLARPNAAIDLASRVIAIANR